LTLQERKKIHLERENDPFKNIPETMKTLNTNSMLKKDYQIEQIKATVEMKAQRQQSLGNEVSNEDAQEIERLLKVGLAKKGLLHTGIKMPHDPTKKAYD
jgi:hypothetical protein